MNLVTLRARLHDRPGALERLIGLLRRRAFAVRRMSVSHARDVVEVVLRIDPARTPPERVRAELLNLHDIIAVDGASAPPVPPTREMLLAWVRPGTPRAATNGRVLSSSAAGVLLEITGSPEEIDDVLTRLDELGEAVNVVRSGEVATPSPEPSPTHEEQ
jgi:acetolactate synthase small subunit